MPNESYDTEALLFATADKLRMALVSVNLHGEGEHEATVKHLARLSQAIKEVCGELRQHTKSRLRDLEKIPMDQLVDFLKRLPASSRRDIGRAISGEDDEEPLL